MYEENSGERERSPPSNERSSALFPIFILLASEFSCALSWRCRKFERLFYFPRDVPCFILCFTQNFIPCSTQISVLPKTLILLFFRSVCEVLGPYMRTNAWPMSLTMCFPSVKVQDSFDRTFFFTCPFRQR